jgi:hypothetical protein
MHLIMEGEGRECWGNSFCLVLPLCFPTPQLPDQLLLLPYPGLWAKLLLQAGSSSRQEGYPSALVSPQPRPP